MLRKIRRGSVARVVPIYAIDKSESPPVPMVGLTNATSGLEARYYRPGDATPTVIPLVAGTPGTWSAGGFSAVPGIPGLYLLGLPDASLAAGDWVCVSLGGVVDLHCPPILIELDAVDYQDAAGFGLSRVDAAVSTRLAPATAGRSLQVAASGHVGIDWANIASPSTTVALANTTVQSSGSGSGVFPANFDKLAIDGSGRVVAGTVADKSGYALAESQTFSTTGSVGSVTGGVTVAGYAAGQTPESRLFVDPARKLDVAVDGSVAARVTDKEGYSLAADGLNMISVADPGAPIGWNSFPKLIVGAFGLQLKKRTLGGGMLRYYENDGTTVAASQAATDDGTVQTLGKLQ